MKTKISIPELSKSIGIKAAELGRLAGIGYYEKTKTVDKKKISSDKIYKGIVEGWRETVGGKEVGFIKTDDIKKISIFYIYKNTKKTGNILEFIDYFNEKYKKIGAIKILNEIGKDFNNIEHLYLTLENSLDIESQLDILEKIMKLINTEKRDIVENKDKEYIQISKGNEMKSLVLTPDCIKNKIIKQYDEAFDTYFLNQISKLTFHNLSSEIYKATSDYNIDKKKYDSKLLKPYKEYFLFLEKKILEVPGNYLLEERNFKEIISDFREKSRIIFKENLEKVFEIIEKIDFFKVSEFLSGINEKIETLTEEQKKFIRIQSYEKNFFSMFMYIDEVLDLYNSKCGKQLNEYFKIHNLFKELLSYLDYFIPKYNECPLDKIRNEVVENLERGVECLGYDYEFEYHLVHDAYQILKDKSLMKIIGINEEKLIEVIQKMLAHGKFFVNSNYHKSLLTKAIETNNPKAIKVLNGHIEGIDKKELLTLCFDYIDTSEMMTPTLNCIEDHNMKAYYKSIYDGDYEMLDFLYEKKKIKIVSDAYSPEIYLCIKGKNSGKVSEVILKYISLDSDQSKAKILKDNFLEVAALWGNKDILEYNILYLQSLPSTDKTLRKILIYSLSQNLIEVFIKIFSEREFDSSEILFEFLTNGNILFGEITKETWEFMFNGPFRDVDVNSKFKYSYSHEKTIAERCKENLHFSSRNKIFLEKLLKESKDFKEAFEEVLSSVEKSSDDREILCYRDFPNEEDIHPALLLEKLGL